MNTQELKDRLVDLSEAAKYIQQSAEAANRDLTDDEQAAFNKLTREFDVCAAELTLLDLDIGDDQPSGNLRPRKSEPNPIGAQNHSGNFNTHSRRSSGMPVPRGQAATDRSFAGMFGREKANDLAGFKSTAEFATCIANGLHHPGLQIKNADMSEGVGADGGFLVPGRLTADMFDQALESELVRPRAMVYPVVGTNELTIAGPDYQTRSSNLAGLSGNWMGEGQTATRQAWQLRDIKLKLNKLGIFTRASNELAEDGIAFDQQLAAAMGNALAFDLDEAFIRGSGVGQPMGILNDDSIITVSKVSSTSPVQAADTLRYQNIVDMWARLHPAFHGNSVWLAHPECVPQLMTMAFDVEATSKTPVYIPSNNTGNAPNGTLMGRPVILTEHCSQLGDKGDIILVDFRQYAIGLRADAALQRSIHESWLSDQVDYRLIIRVTGQPLLSKAITLRNGTNTVSWCVVLEERA